MIKLAAELTVFSIIVATIYGVLFSLAYPLVQITGGIILLCVVLGIATTLIVTALWKLVARRPTGSNQ